MAYTRTFEVPLDITETGEAANLRAQLVDTSGVAVGSAVSTGFVEIGSGLYHWNYASIPDSHRGGVKFYLIADSSDIKAYYAINPEGIAENADAKTSSITTSGPTAVQIRQEIDANSTQLAKLGTPAGASFAVDIAALQTALNTVLNSRLTTARAANLDELGAANLPADIDTLLSRVTSAAATLWANLQYLTAAPPALAAIVNGVLNELLSGHTTTGTVGKAISDILADTSVAGTGSVTVDHDSGGANNLAFQTIGGAGIDNGIIRAYLTSEIASAGNYSSVTARGYVRTNSSGEWETPMYLDPGAYTFTYSTANEVLVTTKTYTVSA